MKNILRIDHKSLQIIMDRTYAKNAENTASPEYQHLQEVRRDYPNYTVIRKTIKKNPTHSFPVQKHTNMKYWRKHRGVATASAFAFCMPLTARRPPPSKKR